MSKKTSKHESVTLKAEGDWKDAVKVALTKQKPEGGWPKPEPMPQRAPKTPRNSKKKPG